MRLCKNKDDYKGHPLKMKSEEYIEKLCDEIIRVTKKKAIISSRPFELFFPEKYLSKIEKKEGSLIVLNCE